jgi:alpha-L-rhamnosidase
VRTAANSFNHYSFGAVDEWMFGVAGGIQLDESAPGYKHFFVHPQPGGGLDHARTTLPTSYGTIVSDWRIEDGTFTLVVEVPVNTTAHVTLPYGGESMLVESGKHTFTQPTGG